MPSKTEPISPDSVKPKPSLETIKDEFSVKELVNFEPPPDVTKLVRKINERLRSVWEPHEIRCGRAYIIGEDFNIASLKEVISIFSKANWSIKVSKELRGVILTFRVPSNEVSIGNKRSRGGYL